MAVTNVLCNEQCELGCAIAVEREALPDKVLIKIGRIFSTRLLESTSFQIGRREMLSIENLTRTEKLRMMEMTWDDLARDSETLASPEWHAQALKETEHALAENQTHFVSWDAAKNMLRNSTP